MIKGAIYAVALLLTLFLVIVLVEHFGYLSSWVRALLFWSYLVAFAVITVFYVIVPLFQMNKLGRRISYEQAAKIIGQHFPEVDDKLLNLLQLQSMGTDSESDLLQACIKQKTEQLSPIPFHNAVNIKANKKYLKYALIPLCVLVLLLLLSPSTVTEPSKRLVNYGEVYERPAPFAFVIDNETLEVGALDDFMLRVSIEGNSVPDEVVVLIGNQRYRMKKVDKAHFTHTFNQVRSSFDFQLEGGGVVSKTYHLEVHPIPVVVDFSVALSYPAYTGRTNEVVSSVGDLTVPRGTTMRWSFQTKDVDTLFFLVDEKLSKIVPDANGRLSYAVRAMDAFEYSFSVKNASTASVDTLKYAVSVVRDAVPSIAVVESQDSSLPDRRLFYGRIKDDYGFSKLVFKLVKSNVDDTSIHSVEVRPLPLGKDLSQEFYYSFNLNEFPLSPGDRLHYSFEVCDNDAVDGPQCASSQEFSVEIPTERELENILDKNVASAERQAQTSMSELKKLQEDINEMMRKLVDKKELNWQDKKMLQELSERQKEVRSAVEKMQQQLKENSALEQKYREQSEQIIEKQNELERLFNEVLDDKMKEMMDEINKLIQETDKKKVQETLESLKLNNEELEKQIDQNIELMKRLELEKKVEESIRQIDDLAKKQRDLSRQTESAMSSDKENLLEQQKQLSEQFNKLQKDIQEIEQGYKEIEPNAEFKVDKELQRQIESHQSEAQSQINRGKNKNASKQQQSAADDMEKLSNQMAEAEMNMEQQDLAEDAEMIRQLLKNLVNLSFSQEELINDIKTIYIQDPKYQNIISKQNGIKRDFVAVEDSLRSIAKRQVNVASAITKEVSSVNINLAKSLSGLLEYNQSFYGTAKNHNAAVAMQYGMTSLNNLSLVLAESLDNMQNQMRQNQQKKKNGNCKRQGMKKQGNCSNPGSGKPSPKSMKQMQDELNKQLEALKKQLDKEGKKDGNGRKKIGEKGSMSEQFAKMAAQQEMIRRMMQEYGQEMKQKDAGNGKLAREIDEMMRQMEQTETDLVNKTISQQTLRRQQQIMSRMLEHEKAEMQREKEERRESREAVDPFKPSPADIEKFKRLQKNSSELLRTPPASLTPFYKAKVNDYFYEL